VTCGPSGKAFDALFYLQQYQSIRSSKTADWQFTSKILEGTCLVLIKPAVAAAAAATACQVSWQIRPWMRWLGAAVRSGRLGGGSAAPKLPLLESFVDSCQEVEAVAEQCSFTEAADTLDGHAGNKATERATAELVSQGEKGFGSSGASNSIGSNKTAREAAGGRAWPWTPCRSVVQLPGCEV
jgi:hypothetical protein